MSSATPIRKAVIPAAGLGTRMRPVSKVVPKELLPLGCKPIIQYAIEEAVASGIEEIVVVTGPRKSWLEKFLTEVPECLSTTGGTNKDVTGKSPEALSSRVRIDVVQQMKPLGLGDALLCAQPVVGEEPFAMILPDAVIDAPEPPLSQLIRAYMALPGAFVATQRVEPRDFARFGMLSVNTTDIRGATIPFRVLSIVEKPLANEAPSDFGVFGRYLLTSEIFADLKQVAATAIGEIQLTDALAIYCQRNPVYALVFKGKHYDAGDPIGYFQAVVEFALKDSVVGPLVREYLTGLFDLIPQETAVVAFPDQG
jgi:UTP--glucose-1-phosphate uridylyltransferase